MKLSNSKLEAFMVCPYKYYLQYELKKEGKEVKSTSMEVGKLLHEVFEHYREGLDIHELYSKFRINYVLSDFDESIIKEMLLTGLEYYKPYAGLLYDSERFMSAEIDKDLTLVGILDKLYYHNPDYPKDGKYRVSLIDYKTGKRKYDNSTQFKFYVTLINKIMNLMPEEVECKVFYLRLNEIVSYNFALDDINEFITYINMITEVMTKTESFNYKFTYNCKYCKFSATECQFYQKKLLMEHNKGTYK